MLSKKILLTAAAFSAAIASFAYSISGTVVDISGEGMPDATVRILRADADSTYLKGAKADLTGHFSFTGFANGKYIIEATYVGYNRTFRDVSVQGADVRINSLLMTETSHLLSEAVVTAVKTPIKVMEDTIEFNADSYKTQPNAAVEGLLKRLPGVEVGTDGSITANGKSVSKILVDGKEFFSDDPKVASKNLPAGMIDKLQVVDRKSDLARMTGVDDGEEETVINLTVKKGMKNGWFGQLSGGYGTDNRYMGNLMINRFWDGNQLTFIGSANNINELGFTDGNSGRFRMFGGQNGITESQSFGMNFNGGKEEIFRVGGDIMYTHTDQYSTQRRNRQYLLENDPYTQNSLSDSRNKGHNLRADFRMEWKPDSFNTLDVRPNFSLNRNNSMSDEFSVAQGKNMSLNRGRSEGTSYEFGTRIIYNHNFRSRRGRSISFMGNYSMSNVREDEDSYAYNIFYQFNDSIDDYDQYLDNHTWNNRVNGRITWTEPIGNPANGNFITLAYSANYRWNNADKLVYDRRISYGDDVWNYEIGGTRFEVPVPVIDYANPELNDTLSNRFRNSTFQQDIRIGYRKVSRKINLNAGLSLVPIRSQSTNLINSDKTIPERWTWNVAPFVRFRYKFGKTSSINAVYNGRASQPSMSQLQPVADYSNPLNIKVGNPSLVPTFTHNIRIRQQHFDSEAQRSIMSMLMVGIARNSIISKTVFNSQTGGKMTTYENVNGVWNARLMNMFSQPLRNKAFTFNNNIFLSYDQRIGYNNGQQNTSRSYSLNESLSFAYRPDYFEFELRPFYRFESTHNSASSITSQSTHRFGGNFYATYQSPFGLSLNSELNFSAMRGYARGYNDDTWMWNASISYEFLRDRSATVQLKAYDLLQQKKDISRTISASYIDNTQYNALTRYFMFSFTYKFNTFGKGNEPQNRNMKRGPHGMRRPPRL